MKRAIFSVTVVMLLTLGLLVGCRGGVAGSGKLITENYDVSNFTRVDVSSAFRINIVQSSSYGVQVTADDNLLKYIEISQEGETLKIGLKTVTLLWPITLEAKVTLPELRGLNISGATQGTVSNFHATKDLAIELSGASRIELVNVSASDVRFNINEASQLTGEITADEAILDINGASTVQLDGSANDMKVTADGASNAKLSNFAVDKLNIKLSGASIGTVNVEGRLDADLNDSSKLTYTGDPTMGTINTSGASSLSWK